MSALALSSGSPRPLRSRLGRGARQILRSPWLHPLNDTEALNDLLGSFNPLWSLTEIRAEVLERIEETADTLSLRLGPNHLWSGFVAGQHVLVSVEIDGVRQQRAYSLSSDPGDDRSLRISIKRQPGGKVSNWLHDHLRIGDVIGLSAPSGEFSLHPNPEPLLLLAAGSGITPMRALLHELQARNTQTPVDIVLVQISRNPADRIFADEIDTLERELPGLRVIRLDSAQGRPKLDSILAEVPDYIARKTYLCGPSSFMREVELHWQAMRIESRLRLERFGIPVSTNSEAQASVSVTCHRSEQQFVANSGEALLATAEQAGLKPAYGCRIGICRTCLCHKRSGVVENLVNGERSSAGDEWIRLCVSAPRSDLELDL